MSPRAGAANEPTDAALVQRLRDGDRAAFSALVGRYGAPLLRLARTIVRNEAVAEEVVQEAWMSALEAIDTFEGRSAFKTWLFRIAANGAKTRAQREGRSIPMSALGPDDGEDDRGLDPDRFDAAGMWRDPPAEWTDESPEVLATRRETRHAIEVAMEGLPSAQRAVITLRDVEGLEAEEICSLLDITLNNQRVLLHRARTRVRLALEDYMRGVR